MGIQLNENTTLYTLHFEDGQVVIARDKEDLEFITRRLIKHYDENDILGNIKDRFNGKVLNERGEALFQTESGIYTKGEHRMIGSKKFMSKSLD